MTAHQAKVLNALRSAGIYVCHFPVFPPGLPVQFKFYVMQGEKVIYNPVIRDEENKITGYKNFDSFEEGMKEAIFEAKKAL